MTILDAARLRLTVVSGDTHLADAEWVIWEISHHTERLVRLAETHTLRTRNG